MLTKKQHELLTFIDNRIQDTGISPSFDEMKEALGLKSKSGIHRLITALEERGFLRRLRHRARALEVVKLPENAAARAAGGGGFRPNVIEGGRSKQAPQAQRPVVSSGEFREVPMMNKIAAGLPIEATEAHSDTLHFPASYLPAAGEHYALTVDGDSMTGVGINDGDTVVVQKCDTARSGEIVVAYIHEDNKATLKTLRMKGESIALEAENPAFETQIYGPGAVTIQGKLVALLRSY
jgi:repressor LexA